MSPTAINIAINVGAVAVWCVCRYLFDRWYLRRIDALAKAHAERRDKADHEMVERLTRNFEAELSKRAVLVPRSGVLSKGGVA